MKRSKYIALILSCLLIQVFSGPLLALEKIDGIAAVVGSEIILLSEVDFQLQIFAMQSKQQNLGQAQADSLRDLILSQMVSDKIILLEAAKDTTIKVTDDQIEQTLTEKINELKSRFNGDADFERQMKLEGLTLRELKTKFRREVKDQLIKERFIGNFLQKVTISPNEVRDFYSIYEDSLPTQPASIRLAGLLLPIKASQATRDSALSKAQEVRKLLGQGGDFAALARLYSQDATAASGGELGYFTKGSLLPELEQKVFGMQKGEISDPIESPIGYHIMMVEDRLPEKVQLRQILFVTKPTEADNQLAISLADSLRQLLLQGKLDFTDAVKEYSIDQETKKEGGVLGWFAIDKLTPEFKTALDGLGVGDISRPTVSEFGVHLLKVLDKQDARKMTLETDWDRIKDFARREKSNRVLETWLARAKQRLYVDIRL